MKISAPCIKNVLKIGRFSISYRLFENKGPHLICINGVQQSMAMWQSVAARFSRDYRMVLFDFPNQGNAKIISGSSQVSLEEQVEILSTVMEKTGLSQDATICAASWGGVIAVAFASKYPDRMKKLILASLGTKPNQKMIDTIKEGYNVDIKDRGQMARVLIKSFGETLPPLVKQTINNQFHFMTEEQLRAFYEHGLFVISSKQLGEVVNLKAIKVKTTLLHGEKDTIIDLEDVKFLASQIPKCELRIIKGVGHFLHMESESVLDIYQEILLS